MSKVNRRQVIGGLAMTGAAPFLTGAQRSPAEGRPNILFVMTDDHQVDKLSCYGHPLLLTPHLDRLAKEGVRFEQGFVTNSLCAPSRASVLTGCYSHRHGIRGNSEGRDNIEKMDPDLPTFPQLLQQAGYRTGIVGKWHLPHDPRGFDYWCVLPGQGLYFDPEFIENGTRKKFQGYATDLTTDFALSFLEQAGSGPFCLVYQHKAPHRPFKPAPRHENLWSNIDLPRPATYNDDYSTRRIAGQAEDMRFDISLAGDYPDLPSGLSAAEKKDWLYQRFLKDYYRAVYGVDENLGRVLTYLDQNGLADNTLVIYTSDNGFFLGEYGWYDKRFMYEPSLRVPFLLRYPGQVAAGQVLPQMVLNIDIAPTILDFAGIPIPPVMQGRSLKPLVTSRPVPDWRTSIYYSYYENSWALRNKRPEEMSDPSFKYFTPHRIGPHRGVRTDRYKLIHYYSEGDYWEFFDLQRDPHELRNAVNDPQYATEVARLRLELRRLQNHYGDHD